MQHKVILKGGKLLVEDTIYDDFYIPAMFSFFLQSKLTKFYNDQVCSWRVVQWNMSFSPF